MKEKMKREMKRNERTNFFQKKKKVSEPSNPPDESAQNASKKIPFGQNYSFIFSKVQDLTVFFIYLHDSNSIFRVGRIESEGVSARTVKAIRNGTVGWKDPGRCLRGKAGTMERPARALAGRTS